MAEAAPRKTVLIADDSRFFRSMLSYALDEDGHRCLAAGSGEEVLEMAARELPAVDAFVFDLVMPGLNGIELVERLRGLPGAASVPVLIVTQFGVNALEREILARHGVRAILPKTVSVERILWEVREALHPEISERRESRRLPASLPVTVRGARGTWIASTFNLSEGGLFLAMPEGDGPRQDDAVTLRFWVPDETELFEVSGRVVWINPPGPGVQRSHPPGFGVLFIEPPTAACAAIGRFLERSKSV